MGGNKFCGLNPEILESDNSIYMEALDYAFNNEGVTNIAITGVYGAGKTSLWRTYAHKKKLSDIITVTLGQYTENQDISQNADGDPEYSIDNNRIEKQILNQIISQIKFDRISYSKYKYNRNLNQSSIIRRVLATISLLLAIIIWFTAAEPIIRLFDSNIYLELMLDTVIFFMFTIPVFWFLYFFYRNYQLRLYKVNIKGAEACFGDSGNDETILDRDLREIVYLLNSSKSSIVVFEDLDRYNNQGIFTKLRELNFILNSYTRANEDGKIIRFVYMIRDGLFDSKDRTKFFDFIIPIVPILDSRNSESHLLKVFDNVDNAPDKNVLYKVSLYIDDMRLLKNIINEYVVYCNIIPLKALSLNKNKLFALIILKNIFPSEFDLLQTDQGYIFSLFDYLEEIKNKHIKNIEKELEELNSSILKIKDRVAKDKFDMMALRIPATVRLNNQDKRSWAEILRDWELEKENNKYFSYIGSNDYSNTTSYKYDDFLNEFVYKNNNEDEVIGDIISYKSKECYDLEDKYKKLTNEMDFLEGKTFKELLNEMNEQEIDKIFNSSSSSNSSKIIQSHYFGLIKFLLLEGLLDETYWYYKGNFYLHDSNNIKKNDIIFMKGLAENSQLDVFLDVENPGAIIERLNDGDFIKKNILNKKVLEFCIKNNDAAHVVAMMKSVDKYDRITELLKILEKINDDDIRRYIGMLLYKCSDILNKIVIRSEKKQGTLLDKIIIGILLQKNINSNSIQEFRSIIEYRFKIMRMADAIDIDVIIKNIQNLDIKFRNLSEGSVKNSVLLKIVRIKAYKLNVENVIYIANRLLGKDNEISTLISCIYGTDILADVREYIDKDYDRFITEYIEKGYDEYSNNEKDLIKILLSNVSNENKMEYLKRNTTIITDLSDLKSIIHVDDFIGILLKKNKITFNESNIDLYYGELNKVSEAFIVYLNENSDNKNIGYIFSKHVDLCNDLIQKESLSEDVFDVVVAHADKRLDISELLMDTGRLKKIIQYQLFDITYDNINFLLDNKYFDLLKLLINCSSDNVDKTNDSKEDEIIQVLLEFNLSNDIVYGLVSTRLSDSHLIDLFKKINEDVDISKVGEDRVELIQWIIENKLSQNNIDYICNHFKEFNLKDEFVEVITNEGRLSDLDKKCVNEFFVTYVLTKEDLDINHKIKLLCHLIAMKINMSTLKKYFSYISEIQGLETVWDNKRPRLDNEYKEIIGQALVDNNYVLKSENDYRGAWIRMNNKN